MKSIPPGRILKRIKRKVLTYITHQQKLLVFSHPNAPEAGIQVPAGTIEEGEAPEQAVLREAFEETGLTDLVLDGFLDEQERDMADFGCEEIDQRYFYHLRYHGQPQAIWQHAERFPSDSHEPHVFEFFGPLCLTGASINRRPRPPASSAHRTARVCLLRQGRGTTGGVRRLMRRSANTSSGLKPWHSRTERGEKRMSLHFQSLVSVPEETARVARLAYPKGNLYLRIRDELGTIYEDQMFAYLFPHCGQPAEAPWRLLLVCLMQFAEGLSDQQAADAVRGRLDWKYLLRLE